MADLDGVPIPEWLAAARLIKPKSCLGRVLTNVPDFPIAAQGTRR